jgi:hypothetical protein
MVAPGLRSARPARFTIRPASFEKDPRTRCGSGAGQAGSVGPGGRHTTRWLCHNTPRGRAVNYRARIASNKKGGAKAAPALRCVAIHRTVYRRDELSLDRDSGARENHSRTFNDLAAINRPKSPSREQPISRAARRFPRSLTLTR